jgi:hypothetical protein
VDSNPILARPTRPLILAFVAVTLVALAVGWTAGTVAASGGSRAASPTTAVGGAADLPLTGNGTAGVQLGAPTTSSGTASIAYPVPGYNQLGVAPEGTIVAEGSATADMKADGSDKAAALKKATDAALADAHAQAAAVAASMGVQLAAIYSISTQTSTNYNYATPECVVPPLVPNAGSGGTSSDGGVAVPASSPIVCNPTRISTPTSSQLVVTLVVAYKFA